LEPSDVIQFSKSGVTISLQNPELNDLLAVRRKQALAERSDGAFYRYELADAVVYERLLAWTELRRAERDNLANFFTSVARGVLEQFTFTDERDVAWNAHFLDPDIDFNTVADTNAGKTTFVSVGQSYPTTTRSGGVYAASIKLRLW